MPPTLRDIASKLSLSPSLVSGVLNERPGVWASTETRQRIQRAARELGYRPNAAARALRSGKTETVALTFLHHDASHLHGRYAGVIETLTEWLGANGYQLLVKVFSTQPQLLASLQEIVTTRACDAIILWGSEADVEEQGLLLETLGMPFVVKGRHERDHPNWPQIDFDHEGMMAAAVARLVALGHRRIAYLGHQNAEIYRLRLLEGFQQAIRDQTGLEAPPDYLGIDTGDPETVQAQVERWLEAPAEREPTALVIGAGNTAWRGVELALARRGRVLGEEPGQFTVAGTRSDSLTLLFGQAHSYTEMELYDLAREMGLRLLKPALAGERLEEPVVRLMPELRPTPCLNLLEYVAFRP